MIVAKGDWEWMLIFWVEVSVQSWKWFAPCPAKMDWSIIILNFVLFHNIVTMQDTMAVQMSKIKNISIYENINFYVFQGMQKRKQ